jgi:hypothetical protein
MAANSENILSSQVHTGDSVVQSVTGERFKGDGYYGRADGLHTVQYSYTSFTGTINIQATLALDPTEDDWFTVHTYTVQNDSDSKIANFIGNYVWIRANLTYTDGSLDNVVLNH